MSVLLFPTGWRPGVGGAPRRAGLGGAGSAAGSAGMADLDDGPARRVRQVSDDALLILDSMV